MAAIVVSVATTAFTSSFITRSASSASYTSFRTTSIFGKFRSFGGLKLGSNRRGPFMAYSVATVNLGLTQATPIEAPKVVFSICFVKFMIKSVSFLVEFSDLNLN